MCSNGSHWHQCGWCYGLCGIFSSWFSYERSADGGALRPVFLTPSLQFGVWSL